MAATAANRTLVSFSNPYYFTNVDKDNVNYDELADEILSRVEIDLSNNSLDLHGFSRVLNVSTLVKHLESRLQLPVTGMIEDLRENYIMTYGDEIKSRSEGLVAAARDRDTESAQTYLGERIKNSALREAMKIAISGRDKNMMVLLAPELSKRDILGMFIGDLSQSGDLELVDLLLSTLGWPIRETLIASYRAAPELIRILAKIFAEETKTSEKAMKVILPAAADYTRLGYLFKYFTPKLTNEDLEKLMLRAATEGNMELIAPLIREYQTRDLNFLPHILYVAVKHRKDRVVNFLLRAIDNPEKIVSSLTAIAEFGGDVSTILAFERKIKEDISSWKIEYFHDFLMAAVINDINQGGLLRIIALGFSVDGARARYFYRTVVKELEELGIQNAAFKTLKQFSA